MSPQVRKAMETLLDVVVQSLPVSSASHFHLQPGPMLTKDAL